MKFKLMRERNKSFKVLVSRTAGKLEEVVGTGWSWLRIGTGGGYLWVRCGTFGFHKCGEFLD
jgi:hypothetical protein